MWAAQTPALNTSPGGAARLAYGHRQSAPNIDGRRSGGMAQPGRSRRAASRRDRGRGTGRSGPGARGQKLLTGIARGHRTGHSTGRVRRIVQGTPPKGRGSHAR